ncbi:unnamed protein product [Ranitomeya imitator]|uniref:Uncharacterized protein n=1 Tax=Ranitomeya imitator TaxID=111125 RepID=A0ABN9KYM5_9NEOB|nr:unnamed protein product [Ranitomeya imitator]
MSYEENPLVYVDGIGVPRGVPDQFKAQNQIYASFASIIPQVQINKNVDWINYIYYSEQRFVNFTCDAFQVGSIILCCVIPLYKKVITEATPTGTFLNQEVDSPEYDSTDPGEIPKYFLYEGNNESVLERTFGSITADTVLSTEFGIHSSKIKEVLRNSQLPMQLHLSYTLPDGRSRRRVLSLRKPVTNDCASALESIDLSVLQIHSVQFSARLAMEGHVNEARNVALELKELIDLVIMRQEKYEAYGVVYEDWENSMAPIYEDLQVYMKEKSSDKSDQDSHVEVHVVKTFSDEMAKMIFHMKRAKNKVLKKIRNQTE